MYWNKSQTVLIMKLRDVEAELEEVTEYLEHARTGLAIERDSTRSWWNSSNVWENKYLQMKERYDNLVKAIGRDDAS